MGARRLNLWPVAAAALVALERVDFLVRRRLADHHFEQKPPLQQLGEDKRIVRAANVPERLQIDLGAHLGWEVAVWARLYKALDGLAGAVLLSRLPAPEPITSRGGRQIREAVPATHQRIGGWWCTVLKSLGACLLVLWRLVALSRHGSGRRSGRGANVGRGIRIRRNSCRSQTSVGQDTVSLGLLLGFSSGLLGLERFNFCVSRSHFNGEPHGRFIRCVANLVHRGIHLGERSLDLGEHHCRIGWWGGGVAGLPSLDQLLA